MSLNIFSLSLTFAFALFLFERGRKERLVTRNHLGLYARENFPSINRSINVDMASMYVAVRLLSVSDKLITDGVWWQNTLWLFYTTGGNNEKPNWYRMRFCPRTTIDENERLLCSFSSSFYTNWLSIRKQLFRFFFLQMWRENKFVRLFFFVGEQMTVVYHLSNGFIVEKKVNDNAHPINSWRRTLDQHR